MEEMILSRRQTPIEIALDVDATGHTTAKKLYEWLELDATQYSRWVRQNITDNPYAEEGKDFSTLMSKTSGKGGRPSTDYLLSASFAKKLAMTSRSPKGEETREYFIKVEDALVKAAEHQLTPAEMFLRSARILVDHENRMAEIENRQESITADLTRLEAKLNPTIGMDYYTITGYISLMKYRVSPDDYSKLGREASRLSRQKGYKIGTAPHPVYGQVGIYHTDILREVFDLYPGKW